MSAHKLSLAQATVLEHSSRDEFMLHDSLISLRRINGSAASELYFSCKPLKHANNAGKQATLMYTAIQDTLLSEGGSLASIVSETIFLRNMQSDIESVREAFFKPHSNTNAHRFHHARTEIQQAPLDPQANLEISIHAIIPNSNDYKRQQVHTTSNCGCNECLDSNALLLQVEGESQLFAGSLCGNGDSAYEQTRSMFEHAEKLLNTAGMDFSHVVRTWIYLREMHRDYPALNKARREFFNSRSISPVPASTGIEGAMVSTQHDLCLGFYAIKSDEPLLPIVMTTPTLNEAGDYGADFVRGMRITEQNKIALHVSGTASIDEQGKTAHVNDIEAQIDRMILNISSLLANQGASFSDIVYAYNYLKDPADEHVLKAKFKAAGLEGFPSIFVHAEVCRPELLCETEVLAVLPQA